MPSTKGIRAGRAFVELFADDSRLVRGLRRAEHRIKAFGAKVRNIGAVMTGLSAALAAPFVASVKHFADYGDAVAKMARRTGLSVEALPALRFVASQTGTTGDPPVPVYEGGAPSEFNGMVRGRCSVEPQHVDINNPEACIWLGTAPYAPAAYSPITPPATGDSSFRFNTGGGTEHITQSRGTVASYGSGAPDFGGAIGVADSGVEGVDIVSPVYNFSETHYLATINKSTYANLTGKVNNASFKGFAAGEVLLLGVEGEKRDGVDDWELTFNFAASPNRANITVGSITGIAKKGWEYMWVRYAYDKDATAKAVLQKPVNIYIEKVYEEGDFGLLGIGTT